MATRKRQPSTVKQEGPGISAYEQRLYSEVERILYQNELTPRTVTDFWVGDRDGIVAHLRQMKNRIIRSVVLSHYVELDDLFNRLIMRHLYGKARRDNAQRRTVQFMLDKTYLLQKLEVVANFRVVSKETKSNIQALNQLRNTLAHRFGPSAPPKKDRLYKNKHDVYTEKGLAKFRNDMWNVDEELQPEIAKLAMDLVVTQKEWNRRQGVATSQKSPNPSDALR